MIKQKPINMQKVREKLEQLKNPGGSFKGNPDKWSPKRLKKGETKGEISTVRIIQNPFDDDPFVEKHFHYGVGRGEHATFLCLKRNYGKDCPACEYASFLWNSDSEQDKELAKGLFSRNRQHAIVVDREDEEPTPRYWGFGMKVYDELVQKLEHKDYQNFMNYYEGIDIEVSYAKTKPGQTYPNTNITFSRNNTPLAESDSEIQKILDKIKSPEEVFKPLTKSQIDEQLNSWLSETKEDEGETVKEGSVTESTTESEEEEVELSQEAVDEAFAQLNVDA